MLVFLVLYGCQDGPADRDRAVDRADTGGVTATRPTGTDGLGRTDTGATDTGATGGTTATGTGPEDTTAIAMTAVPDLAHVHQVLLTLDAPATVTCTAGDDEHQVDIDGELLLGGLLAETAYTCVAEGEAGRGEVGFTTGELPPSVPVLTAEGTPGWGAYTLISHWWTSSGPKSTKGVVYDPEGRPRWYHIWEESPGPGVEITLLDDGVMFGVGGRGLEPTLIELDGLTERWRGPVAPLGLEYHHDGMVRDDGTVVGLREVANHDPDKWWLGFGIDVVDPATDDVIWAYDSQEAVERGILYSNSEEGDPWHANALAWVPDDPQGPAFWVSLGELATIARVDATTGLLTWLMNEGTYTVVDDDGLPAVGQPWFQGQHDIQVEPPRMWLHDNRGRHGSTRVVEYEVDTLARTLRVVDEWTEDGWYEPHFGSVDELPGDRWLIGRGHDYRDGPEGHVSQVMEVDRTTREVVHRLIAPSEFDAFYRAERLDGCAMFHNTAHCPP